MRNFILVTASLLSFCCSIPASASEAITYTYDAKGRLVKVERSGSVNNGVKVEYVHDKSDNRRNIKVTGSPNTPP